MNALAHTSVRLATLATLVVGLAVAPAAAAPEPESVRCNQAPRPAPVCSIEKAAPIYHARPVLAPPDGRPVGIIHRTVQREAGDGFQPHRRGDTAISSDATTRSDPRLVPLGSTVEAARGFDWADAAIGAAVALGAALLLVTASRAVRGHRRLGGRAGASAL